jgi:hypothetical protein
MSKRWTWTSGKRTRVEFCSATRTVTGVCNVSTAGLAQQARPGSLVGQSMGGEDLQGHVAVECCQRSLLEISWGPLQVAPRLDTRLRYGYGLFTGLRDRAPQESYLKL